MTREEIMRMNAEELRLAIAKIRGFEFRKGREWWNVWKDGKRYNRNSYAENMVTMDLPDWPTSIADAWELEGALAPKLQERYAYFLFWITSGYEGEAEAIIRWGRGLYEDQYFALLHASPEQRCRAWLLAQEAQP